MLFEEEGILYEYNLRIVPPESICQKVVGAKSLFFKEFGLGKYGRSKPHITIADFLMLDEYGSLMIKHLEAHLFKNTFKLLTHGFSGFESQRIVFIDICPTAILTNQSNVLKKMFHFKLRIPKRNTKVIEKFHITIDQAQSKLGYVRALELLKKTEFEHSFLVTQFVLVKRVAGRIGTWLPCQTFTLK